MTQCRESARDELTRLVNEYNNGERQYRAEAWNLIADCVVDRWPELSAALGVGETLNPTATKES